MQPRSLAARTDLAVLGPAARIEDHGDHLVARCPDNPGFIWGNYLLFAEPPRPGDLPRWCRLYDEAFGSTAGIINRTFLWDRTDGEVGAADEFVAAGFKLERTSVLTCRRPVRPDKWNRDIEIRPVAGDAEYAACVDMQVDSREPVFSEASYRNFRRARMAAYRAMVEAGCGTWYGAFFEGRLVGDLGLFHGDRLGRYQFVTTAPDFRRRYVCSTLLFTTAAAAFASGQADVLVIASDPEYHATTIYESVGFGFAEWQAGLTARRSDEPVICAPSPPG